MLALVAGVSCSEDDENSGWTEPMKVATYNIQYDNKLEDAGKWENRMELMKQMLKDCVRG